MNNIKKLARKIIEKYGVSIASFAFAFVIIAANTSCGIPYYEPEEPKNISKFKVFNK